MRKLKEKMITFYNQRNSDKRLRSNVVMSKCKKTAKIKVIESKFGSKK